jgi:hypothetical protein
MFLTGMNKCVWRGGRLRVFSDVPSDKSARRSRADEAPNNETFTRGVARASSGGPSIRFPLEKSVAIIKH